MLKTSGILLVMIQALPLPGATYSGPYIPCPWACGLGPITASGFCSRSDWDAEAHGGWDDFGPGPCNDA